MIKAKRYLLIGAGVFFTGLGIVGIVTPVLPTTVFLLIAGGLFSKASPGLYAWLYKNRITGPFLTAYIDGAGLSRKRKIITIIILWITLLISAWFVQERLWLLIILGLVGIGVTLHVSTIKGHKDNE